MQSLDGVKNTFDTGQKRQKQAPVPLCKISYFVSHAKWFHNRRTRKESCIRKDIKMSKCRKANVKTPWYICGSWHTKPLPSTFKKYGLLYLGQKSELSSMKSSYWECRVKIFQLNANNVIQVAGWQSMQRWAWFNIWIGHQEIPGLYSTVASKV